MINFIKKVFIIGCILTSAIPAYAYITTQDAVTVSFDLPYVTRGDFGWDDRVNDGLVSIDTILSIVSNDMSQLIGKSSWIIVDGSVYARTDVGIEAAIADLPTNGGTIYLPEGTYTLADSLNIASNIRLIGSGWGTILNCTATDGSPAIEWAGAAGSRLTNFTIENCKITGNASSGDGIYISYTEDAGDGINAIRNCWITANGDDGIYWQYGDELLIEGCLVDANAGHGISIYQAANMACILKNSISGNSKNGVYIAEIASNAQIMFNSIHDNTDNGVYAYRAEGTQICHNAFNRNGGASDAGIKVVGQVAKYSEGCLIMGNLLGDNGSGVPGVEADYDIILYYTNGVQIIANYFYAVDELAFIRLADHTRGTNIAFNQYKSTEELGSGVLSLGTPTEYGSLTYSHLWNYDVTHQQDYRWDLYEKDFTMWNSRDGKMFFSYDEGKNIVSMDAHLRVLTSISADQVISVSGDMACNTLSVDEILSIKSVHTVSPDRTKVGGAFLFVDSNGALCFYNGISGDNGWTRLDDQVGNE